MDGIGAEAYDREYTDRQLLARILTYFRPHLGQMVLVALFIMLNSLMEAAFPFLIARGLDKPWTCYLNPRYFDQPLANVMARAGCSGVEIGSDSGTNEGLERLRKGFTTDDIRRASRMCREAGIMDCHTFVLGARGDTLDDVERSLDFIDTLDPHAAIIMAYKDDREALNAELAARMGEFRARVLEAIARRAADRPRWSVPSLGLRFNGRYFSRLRKRGVRGPLWQYVR